MDDDSVSLREFEQRLAAIDKATELQAKEYERRLSELNHAHAKAEERDELFLKKEVFEITLAEWRIWRDSVNSMASEAKGRAVMLSSVISIGVGLIVFILSHIWK
jgi:hypothetical protein